MLDIIVRGSNKTNSINSPTSAKTSSKERSESDNKRASKKRIPFRKQKKIMEEIQEKYYGMKNITESSPRKSPEKESTESFENLGKGLVVIVSKEDSPPKNRSRNVSREIESKHSHSPTNSKDRSSKGLTRDEDNSDGNKNLSVFRKTRKNSASFTAVFGSENMSNNSVSPVSGSETRNEIFRKYSNDAITGYGSK